MQRHQEIVRARRAVVLLRIEPARCDVGVPGQRQLALRHDGRGARCAAWGRNLRQRRGAACQHAASVQCDRWAACRSVLLSFCCIGASHGCAGHRLHRVCRSVRRRACGSLRILTSRHSPSAEAEPGRSLSFRIRPPVAARPEGGLKDPPLECGANIAETHASGNSIGWSSPSVGASALTTRHGTRRTARPVVGWRPLFGRNSSDAEQWP